MMDVLYVPVAVEAVVAGKENSEARRIAKIAPDFTAQSVSTLGGAVEPQPFGAEPPLEAGVHLHFLLPDTLTHAVMDQQSASYPQVPNRWLVTRMLHSERDSGRIETRCWVVESDHVSHSRSAGQRKVTIPVHLKNNAAGTRPWAYLGRRYGLDETPAPAEGYLPGLTALGWGDPAFSAYYPSCFSVFGFHDDLDGAGVGTLTYLVAGWFADPGADPLHDAATDNWEQLLETLQWHAGTEPRSRTVCHGAVTGIQWKGRDADYPIGPPEGTIDVAVGNSSVEAMSALIGHKFDPASAGEQGVPGVFQTLERFLTLLQYDLLDEIEQIDGVFHAQDAIHQNEFKSLEGGSYWVIRQADETGGEHPPAPTGIGERLNALNETQAQLDGLERERGFHQQAMHKAWYQYMLLYEDAEASPAPTLPTRERFAAEIQRIRARIDEMDTVRTRLSAYLNALVQWISEELAHNHPLLLLQKTEAAPFHSANDPVVLAAGDGVGRVLFPDEHLDDGERLPCRERVVTSLSGLRDGQPCTLGKAEILACCAGIPSQAAAYDWYADLLTECICLAPDLVKAVEYSCRATGLTAVGEPPFAIAVSSFEQSYRSLFLEWQAEYFPTKTAAIPDDTMKGWALGEIDFSYAYEAGPIPLCSYQSRTILTPHSTRLFSDVVLKYAERYKDSDIYPKLVKVADYVRGLKILSQSLGGFNELLLSTLSLLELPRIDIPPENLASFVNTYTGAAHSPAVYPATVLMPLRGGFLRVPRLQIVTSFGCRYTVASQYTRAILSEQVRPSLENKAEHCAMLPPRITQYSRCFLKWRSVREPALESNADPATSPVCGFLMPGHLNRGLLVYDADGTYKGTLKLVYREGRSQARWISVPDGVIRRFDEEEFTNDHIRQFARSILDYNGAEEAFDDLLRLIDWRLDGILPQAGGQHLSMLCGRPLVLARAAAGLQLATPPVYSQRYEDLGGGQSFQFDTVPFELKIGDALRRQEGTVGYYVDAGGVTDYSRFFPAASTPDLNWRSGFVQSGGSLWMSIADGARDVTLLVVPELPGCVRSGILPAFTLGLPPDYYSETLDRMQLAFEINPILSETDEPYLPLPDEKGTAWSWRLRDGAGGYRQYTRIVPTQAVFHEQPTILMDGYLMGQKEDEPS